MYNRFQNMVSFLLIAKDKEKRITYARDFCAKHSIDKFDITIIERDASTKDVKQSIGIEEVKLMQKKIFFKPIKSPTKAVIIEDAQLLTNEAQNALLKVLEEPPAHTILILGATSKEAFLPTIISRCQLIQLEEEHVKLTEKAKQDLSDFIEQLPSMPIGDKLKKAEALAKDKEKALVWIEKLILVLREKTLHNSNPSEAEGSLEPEGTHAQTYIFSLRVFQKLHTTLKTSNVNPRFAIENALLTL